MSIGIVLSLYDFTGEACKPWAEAGYECHAFDIQHIKQGITQTFEGGGSINYTHANLHDFGTHQKMYMQFSGRNVVFGMAFPVCTDMAVSGAAWFKKKAEADPQFQTKAVVHAVLCADLFADLGVPYFIENPISVLATKWRKPDHRFHPYQFGGYIPTEQAEHPRWPEYIAPRDAYRKSTCLWTGGGFAMPEQRPVEAEAYHGNGYNTATMKLGGKSQRTKDIRSATPRGFSIAAMVANAPQINGEGVVA